MEHDLYREMLATDALGALDEAERTELDAHLKDCAACRADADALRDVASMLVYTTTPTAPPAELRTRILANIKTIRQDDAHAQPAETHGGQPLRAAPKIFTGEPHVAGDASNVKGDVPGVSDAASNVLPFTAERDAKMVFASRRTLRMLRLGAIAATLAAVALGVGLFVLWQRTLEMRAQMARADASAGQTQAELAQARDELARERQTRELLAAPDTSILTLAGTKSAPGARAKFAYDAHTGRALLLAYDLPPAPDGKAYQLWFITGARPPVPGRVFKTDAAGRGTLADQAPAQATDADTFAVTLEPEAGVQAPTGEIYLLGKSSS